MESTIIRMASRKDIVSILTLYKPYIKHSHTTFETEIPTLKVFEKRILKIQQKLPWLICIYGGNFAGYAYATDHRIRSAYQWTKELSVYIHDQYQQKGIASALYTTLTELLRIQGVTNCLAGIALPNDASIKFHEKFGFKKVGIYHRIGYKHKRFFDVGWWEFFIHQDSNQPKEIIPIHDVERTKEFDSAVKKGLNCIY